MMAGTHGNHHFVCNLTWVPAGAGMTEQAARAETSAARCSDGERGFGECPTPLQLRKCFHMRCKVRCTSSGGWSKGSRLMRMMF